MSYLSKIIGATISFTLRYYIKLVFNTSQIIKKGNFDQLTTNNKEKFIILFWHGDSFSIYPILKGEKLDIITTRDRRGDYITSLCNSYGYKTIRLPDESRKGKFLFKIKKQINEIDNSNLAIALDGPLGPYHVPKDFPFVLTRFSRRRIIPINLHIKKKITVNSRWDKFKIPLPFNEIEFILNEPINITKKDMEEKFSTLKDNIREIMEK